MSFIDLYNCRIKVQDSKNIRLRHKSNKAGTPVTSARKEMINTSEVVTHR